MNRATPTLDIAKTDQAPVPKFRTPRPTCRWEKASYGALVMVWSIADTRRPALHTVSGTDADSKINEPRRKVMNRARSLSERAAVALLLVVSGYLTLLSFTSDYTNFP
jgi:hypothetical protein